MKTEYTVSDRHTEVSNSNSLTISPKRRKLRRKEKSQERKMVPSTRSLKITEFLVKEQEIPGKCLQTTP